MIIKSLIDEILPKTFVQRMANITNVTCIIKQNM